MRRESPPDARFFLTPFPGAAEHRAPAGLDIFGVFLANAAFAAGMVLFEIPTGVVADTLGRRVSFLVSLIVVSAGTLGYVAAEALGMGVVGFAGASILLGLGYCFYSGAVEAWLVDALTATGFSEGLDRVFAKGQIVTGAGMLIGTVGGGLLSTIDLTLPYLVRAALLLPLFGLALHAMHDLGFERRPLRLTAIPAEMGSIARASVAYGWRSRSLKLLMMVSFLQLGFLSWAFYAWQPYFLELLGRDVVWVAGVVGAALALATIVGNSIVEWLARFCGHRTTLLLWASGVQAGAAVGVGLTGSFWLAVALIVLYMATTGVVGPVKSAYLHEIVPTGQRATVISFDAMLGNAGGVVGQVGLGYLSRAGSIAGGYVSGGLAVVLAVPLLFVLRQRHRPADVIVGSAGRIGGCAGARSARDGHHRNTSTRGRSRDLTVRGSWWPGFSRTNDFGGCRATGGGRELRMRPATVPRLEAVKPRCRKRQRERRSRWRTET